MTIPKRAPRLLLAVGLAGAVLALPACHRRAATLEDCRAVLGRLIDLELRESGYRDPVLRSRWQQDLELRFRSDLERCRGLTVPDDLRACLAAARAPEEITHRCLE
jgi:hypothetical protein